jgi:predicted RNase H-like HicB family nuclease
MKWRVVLKQDSETGDWAVWCPELPGCASAGITEDEAVENIREAIELYLEPAPLELVTGAVTREVEVAVP